ncbi:MAG: ABC transporter ATP-binding protein [Candidatus Sumerlaeaceae bacterium]|nr:ABC transporter ATP-binding protein [Candidatus Sumerlaeaceae bacterium]
MKPVQTPADPRNSVEVRGVSKRFLVETGSVGRASAFFLYRVMARAGREELWALRDVSFDVAHGEMVGIVGVNGSGKTTLLRLISGISQPTAGEIRRPARVGALLDVSVGFHPNLTGYENLFLGASLLGIARDELRARLGDIVSFSGVDPEYLETPVRYYSAGMLTRLGFSLAVNVDPDVILLDEVLAVGDAEFQAQSARRLLAFAEQGKAMIVVSHVVNVVQQLCRRSIWLDAGRVRAEGPSEEVLRDYRAFLNRRIEGLQPDKQGQDDGTVADPAAYIAPPALDDGTGRTPEKYATNGCLRVRARVTARQRIPDPDLMVTITHDTGAVVDEFFASERGMILPPFGPESAQATLTFEPLLLYRGRYGLSLQLVTRSTPQTPVSPRVSVEFQVDMPYTAQPVYCAEIPVRFEIA